MQYNYLKQKEIESDKSFFLLKCDGEEYLSYILMSHTLYDKLSDIMIKEDVDYFWELRTNELTPEQYEIVRDTFFKFFGKKVNLKGTDYVIWLLGSIPAELLPYLQRMKDG